MGKWTTSDTSKSRLAWINIMGVPLNYWNDAFFFKLREIIGEPLVIEEDTKQRKRLDKGRLMVLIPFGHQVPNKINVVEGENVFSVVVEEDLSPVNKSWLVGSLGLTTVASKVCVDVIPDQEKGSQGTEKKDGDFLYLIINQTNSNKASDGVGFQLVDRELGQRKLAGRQGNLKEWKSAEDRSKKSVNFFHNEHNLDDSISLACDVGACNSLSMTNFNKGMISNS
ncbi:hypothetical protein Q3G72_022891 [Acer saccharum]|nr:hypothetical protein Q3G72_022891 [Acer saccharum]